MNYHAFKLLQHSLSASARKSYVSDIQICNASINLSKISFVMGKRVSVLPANLLQPFNNFRTIKEEVGS
jgi:hypothetical protein